MFAALAFEEEFIGPVPVSYGMELVARVETGNLLLNDKPYVDVIQAQAVQITTCLLKRR